MAEQQRALIIVKPDAMQRALAGEIISAFERRGLRLCGLKLIRISPDLAERHYAVHRDKPFFRGLVHFITSSPVIVGVLQGPDAVATVRATMGTTNPVQADPGSIRGRHAVDISHNLVHGSDSPDTASYEIGLFFEPHELLDYPRDIDAWIA